MDLLGKLLVAPPAQDDDFWSKSVILVYEQNNGNNIGLTLNKTSDKSLENLAKHHGIVYSGKDQLYIGGPVNMSALVMLHTDDWICTNTMHITGGYRISSDRSMLSRICSHDSPRRWRMFLGMAAWMPGQLESELSGTPPWDKKRSWLVAPAEEHIVFEKNPEKMWKRAIDSAVQEMTDSFFSIN